MKYMQKHFVPSFDGEALENHLNMVMSRNKGREDGVQFPCKIRLLSDSVTVYTGAGFEYVMAGSVSNRDFLEIIEVREGKESILWGRLKSSAGWIPLNKSKIIINE